MESNDVFFNAMRNLAFVSRKDVERKHNQVCEFLIDLCNKNLKGALNFVNNNLKRIALKDGIKKLKVLRDLGKILLLLILSYKNFSVLIEGFCFSNNLNFKKGKCFFEVW